MRWQCAARRLVTALSLCGLLHLSSCAKMGTPPGGPEDKTGPSAVGLYPEANATNVPRHVTARLRFSEPVNRASVESSLFLSPDPMQRLHYRWRGDELDLIYVDELEPDRTYVISVGTQAKDLRGNPAGQVFTLAFSTGAQIDRGRIDGWITDVESPQSVSIWAYRIRGDSIPEPMTQVADYRMQPDDAGKIHLDFLRAGMYRVFAVTDKDRNNLWNPSSELIGIPPWDVHVTDSTWAWVSFKLADQDTALPSLRSVKEIHPQEIQIRLSAPVDTVQEIRFVREGDTVGTVDHYRDPQAPDTWNVFPSRKLAAGEWTTMTSGLTRFGEPWSASDSLSVRERADTTRPKMLTSAPPLKGRSRTVLSAVRMEFVEPLVVDTAALAEAFFRTSKRDSLQAVIRQVSPRVLTATPDTTFGPGNYTLYLNGPAIRDLSDNALGDSTVDMRFGFYAPDSLGSLQLTLAGSPGQHVFSVFAVKDHLLVHRQVSGSSAGIANLVPGRYTLEVANDVNSDSVFSYGRMTPWHFSEPYIVPADTVSIRARWEQEIQLTWPKQSY